MFSGAYLLYAQPESSTKTVVIKPQGKSTEARDVNIKKDDAPVFGIPDKKKSSSILNKKEEKKINIKEKPDLVAYKPNIVPKAFIKDSEVAPGREKSDQYLGDFTTNAKFIGLKFRDHEYEDGDRISILINGELFRENIYLSNSFKGVLVDLKKGFNRIDFLALNQGSSGPNTAELHVYDDNGNAVHANRWNLTTGSKATIIVVKNSD
ncbi:MAG: hypothetical protein RQ756_06650 [Flavobacteriaceae bacterium]|nr:hypothetical protein [Flavobacteriaceae bacterium]